MQYADISGTAKLKLHWTPPAGVPDEGVNAVIPGSVWTQDYGLANGSTTDDSAPSGVAGVSRRVRPLVCRGRSLIRPVLRRRECCRYS